MRRLRLAAGSTPSARLCSDSSRAGSLASVPRYTPPSPEAASSRRRRGGLAAWEPHGGAPVALRLLHLAACATLPGIARALELSATVPAPDSSEAAGTTLSYLSMSLVAAMVTISAAAGVGGGAVIVPLLMITQQIGPHRAIPMSKVTILGSAVCQLSLNWRKRHKIRPDRPLIDFDICLMLVPPTLLGTAYGVLLNRMAPRWLIAVLLALFLGATSCLTSRRAVKLYAEESERIVRRTDESVGIAQSDDTAAAAEESAVSNVAEEADHGTQAAGPSTPYPTIVKLCAVQCAILAAEGLRHSTLVECGSWVYWLMLAALSVAIVLVSCGQ
jgi:hypothetical protein